MPQDFHPISLCLAEIAYWCFGTDSHSPYVEKLKKDLQSAYERATKSATQVHLQNKRNYEKVMRNQVIVKGYRVLLKNLCLKGKHKLLESLELSTLCGGRKAPWLACVQGKTFGQHFAY